MVAPRDRHMTIDGQTYVFEAEEARELVKILSDGEFRRKRILVDIDPTSVICPLCFEIIPRESVIGYITNQVMYYTNRTARIANKTKHELSIQSRYHPDICIDCASFYYFRSQHLDNKISSKEIRRVHSRLFFMTKPVLIETLLQEGYAHESMDMQRDCP